MSSMPPPWRGQKYSMKRLTTAQADAAARLMFANNADDAGNKEMNAAPIDITVQFSATVNPFVPGSYVPGTENMGYVRVAATGFTMPAWLIQVLGFNDKTVAASAVAGPNPAAALLLQCRAHYRLRRPR